MTSHYVGIDVGTSAVKVAVFDTAGVRRGGARRAMPPLTIAGEAATQSPLECLAAVRAALDEAGSAVEDAVLLALTTQRDTALLTDAAGTPVTPLISWRDVRDRRYGTAWDGLAATDPAALDRAGAVHSLTSWLSWHLTGRSAETTAAQSRHLQAGSVSRLQALAGRPIAVPELVPPGAFVGTASAGVPLHLAGGDKNCELLGNGVVGPDRAGLSLGSAISFGTTVSGSRPAETAAVVVTPAPFAGAWNLETGLLVGMQAETYWSRLLTGERVVREDLRDGLWCLPHLAGALDQPTLPGALVGLSERDSPGDIFQAWAQGVVGEVRRLRPLVEAAAGGRFEQLIVGGGGAARAWPVLLADALHLPVLSHTDSWRGARGAVLSALLAQGESPLDRWNAEPESGTVTYFPDPRRAERAEAYYTTYAELSGTLAELFRARTR